MFKRATAALLLSSAHVALLKRFFAWIGSLMRRRHFIGKFATMTVVPPPPPPPPPPPGIFYYAPFLNAGGF